MGRHTYSDREQQFASILVENLISTSGHLKF